MANNDGELRFGTKIDNSGFEKGVKEIQNQGDKTAKKWKTVTDDMDKNTNKAGNTAKKVFSSVGSVASKAFDLAKKAVLAFSASLAAGALAGLKYNATIESYTTSFEVMTGSAEKATEIVEKLKKIGAETPFELTGLAETTQLLMNYGFTADEAVDRMMMLGDISQGNADKMNRIAMAYGQMSSAGKVQLEDIKQMIEAGFNPLQEISETTGESMESLYDRISKGTISVDEITESMIRSTSEGGKYFQSMEKQSKTLQGRLSTLKDVSLQTLGTIFEPLTEDLKNKFIPQITKNLEELQKTLEKKGTTAFVNALGSSISAGINAMVNEIPNILNSAEKTANAFFDGFKIDKNVISQKTKAIFDSLLNFIDGTLPRIIEAGGKIASALLKGISFSETEIKNVVSNFINSLSNAFSEISIDLLPAGASILTGIMQGITESAPTEISKIFNNVIQAIKDFVLIQLPNLQKIGKQMLISIGDGIINWLANLQSEDLSQLIVGIATFLGNAQADWNEIGIRILLNIVQGIFLALPTLIESIPQIIAGMVQGFFENKIHILQIGKDLINDIITGMISMIPFFQQKSIELENMVANAMLKVLYFIDVGKSFVNNIITGISNKINDLINKAKSTANMVAEAFKSILPTFTDIGSKIISNIWNGFSASIQWLKDKISSALGSIGNLASQLFGFSRSSYTGYGYSIFDSALSSRSAVVSSYSNSYNTTNNNATYNFYNTQTSPDSIRRSVQRVNTYGLAGGVY